MKFLRKIILVLIACLFVGICFCTIYYIKLLWARQIFLYQTGSCLKLYLMENSGRFPSSKDDLLTKGYLKLNSRLTDEKFYDIKILSKNFYEWTKNDKLDDKSIWSSIHFDRYSIRYGIKIESLEIRNGRLTDIISGSPVLLIEGPSLFLLKREYKKVSHDLYKEMLRFQKDKTAEAIGSDKKIDQ